MFIFSIIATPVVGTFTTRMLLVIFGNLLLAILLYGRVDFVIVFFSLCYMLNDVVV